MIDAIDAAFELAEAQTGVRDNKAKLRLCVNKEIKRMPRWTPKEDEFLRANLGRLSELEIAHQLRKTPTAVHMRWTRQLHLAAPSKHTDTITAEHIASGLGKDSKSIHLLIDRGILPGRKLPNVRNMRVVYRRILVQWLLNPRNWVYISPDRIGELRPHGKRGIAKNYDFAFWESVARLVSEAYEHWSDKWLTPGQVAGLLNLPDAHYVNHAIRSGKLTATRWGNWWILKSAIPAGMTLNFRVEWVRNA